MGGDKGILAHGGFHKYIFIASVLITGQYVPLIMTVIVSKHFH